MVSLYRVVSTPAFDRSVRKLVRKVPRVEDVIDELLAILAHDPLNISSRHNIRKLIGVPPGEGQWRIRSGVYRLRYDVEGNLVILHSINHRSAAY